MKDSTKKEIEDAFCSCGCNHHSASNCDCGCINHEHINKAREALEDSVPLNLLVDFFKSFGDKTRLKIICILDKLGEMCVCDIAYTLDMTKSAISHQLTYLKAESLVKQKKVGKEVYYSLADEHVKDLFELGIEHIKEKLL